MDGNLQFYFAEIDMHLDDELGGWVVDLDLPAGVSAMNMSHHRSEQPGLPAVRPTGDA